MRPKNLLLSLLFGSFSFIAGAQLPAVVQQQLTSHLEILSEGWVQSSVDASNAIFIAYDDFPIEDWEAFFEDYFSDHYFTDDLRTYLIYPTFYWFSQQTHLNLHHGLFNGLTLLQDRLMANTPNLSVDLANNAGFRMSLVNTNFFFHLYLKPPALMNEGLQSAIFDYYLGFIGAYPQYFWKTNSINLAAYPYLGVVRAQINANLANYNYLDPSRKAEITQHLGIDQVTIQRQKDLWNEFDVIVSDNNLFTEKEFETIYEVFSIVPRHLHHVLNITVTDLIDGTGYPILSVGGFNLFNIPVGSIPENGFAGDVPPHYADVFTLVLVHELNHSVETHGLQVLYPLLEDFRTRLIAAAGNTSMNYLRSMFSDDFFVNAPQEFFASISNIYFANSQRTLELGLTRFNDGYHQPINQFLLFANVYSSSSETIFYSFDTQANFTVETRRIEKDPDGFITRLYVSESEWYDFMLDENKFVTDIELNTCENVYPEIICPEEISVFTDPGSCGATVDLTATVAASDCPVVVLSFATRPIDAAGNPLGLGFWTNDPGNFFEVGYWEIEWTAINEANNSSTCTTILTVLKDDALPFGWIEAEIGAAAGDAGYDPCEQFFTVSAKGSPGSTSDVQQYAYTALCGDFELVTRIDEVNDPGWAGLMVRENNSPGARKVAIKTQLKNLLRWDVRTVANTPGQSQPFNRHGVAWLKLVRSGNNFESFTSQDGTSWLFAYSVNLPLGNCVEAGLFTEGKNKNKVTSGIFSQVTINGVPVWAILPQALTAHPNQPAPLPESVAIFVEPGLDLFPNPANSVVTIRISGQWADETLTLTIYDLNGRAMTSRRVNNLHETKERISLEDLPGGIYLLEARSGDQRLVRKFVVNKNP